MSDLMAQNIFYCSLFMVSMIVILRTLKRIGADIAYYCTAAAFLLLSLYIPFYFGGSLMGRLFCNVFRYDGAAEMFARSMQETLAAPFIFVKFISAGSAFAAIVTYSVSFIAALCIVFRIVKLVKNTHIAREAGYAAIVKTELIEINYVENYRNVYKRLLRLRN